jgi:GrpB-like predicted nucleotidyltransferase (UPF0157 family)
MTSPLVVDYDPAWRDRFEELRTRLSPCLDAGALAIEHVGSTAVPGLASKPIIDADIVTRPGGFDAVHAALRALGYEHRGDQGVPEREVFKLIDRGLEASLPKHHLYVCEEGSPPLRSHRMYRDFLRSRPDLVEALSADKRDAAERAGQDREIYMELKAPAYARIVAAAILAADE